MSTPKSDLMLHEIVCHFLILALEGVGRRKNHRDRIIHTTRIFMIKTKVCWRPEGVGRGKNKMRCREWGGVKITFFPKFRYFNMFKYTFLL